MGTALMGFSLIAVMSGVLDLIDPVGSKVADDADPTGAPNATAQTIYVTAAYGLLAAVGYVLAFVRRAPGKHDT